MAQLKIQKCVLKSIHRTPAHGGTAAFVGQLRGSICRELKWAGESEQPFQDSMTKVSLTGELFATRLELESADGKLAQYKCEVKATSVYGFSAVRRELTGQRGKGFQWDLHFSADFPDLKGCAALEKYMVNAGQSEGTLTIVHEPKAEQTTLEEAPPKSPAEVDQMVDDLRKRIKNDPKKAN